MLPSASIQLAMCTALWQSGMLWHKKGQSALWSQIQLEPQCNVSMQKYTRRPVEGAALRRSGSTDRMKAPPSARCARGEPKSRSEMWAG